MIVEGLDAGKWVFGEKPMAETDEEARAVLEAKRRAKGRLAIGFNRRFARCLLDGTKPANADGAAGARSTAIALASLKSLETGQTITL